MALFSNVARQKCLRWCGRNLKRQASRASLQRSPDDQILTPEALYTWAEENLTNTKVFFSGKAEYEAAKAELKDRFDKAKTITGTQKNHAFIPVSDTIMLVKKISEAADGQIFGAPKSVRSRKGNRRRS